MAIAHVSRNGIGTFHNVCVSCFLIIVRAHCLKESAVLGATTLEFSGDRDHVFRFFTKTLTTLTSTW